MRFTYLVNCGFMGNMGCKRALCFHERELYIHCDLSMF